MRWGRHRPIVRGSVATIVALMQPWIVIAILLTTGAALLVVAPRLHRRSLERARRRLERDHRRRVEALRARPGADEVRVADRATAVRARDRLLLRGVRVEIVESTEGVVLVHTASDSDEVADAVAAVATDDDGVE